MNRAVTLFVVGFLLVGLSGCAKTVWYKEDATQQQFAEDQKACAGEPGTKYPSSGFTGAANLDRFYLPCMQERGWTLQQGRSVESQCPLAWPAPCDPAFIDACPSCKK